MIWNETNMVPVRNLSLVSGQSTKKPVDWKNFLMNSKNKSQMVDVMNEV